MSGIAICGAGGFARETLLLLEQLGLASRVVGFFETDDVWSERRVAGQPVLPLSRLDPDSEVVLAVGDPALRAALRARLGHAVRFPVLVHPTAQVGGSARLADGVILCAGAVVTCDIELGRHVIVDRQATVGHDAVLGDFTTLAPGAVVSGNCRLGVGVYVGASASVRERVVIADHVRVGMGAAVVKDIDQAGTYVGVPARRLDPA